MESNQKRNQCNRRIMPGLKPKDGSHRLTNQALAQESKERRGKREEEAVVRTGVTMDRTLDSNTRKEVAGASRQIRSVTTLHAALHNPPLHRPASAR